MKKEKGSIALFVMIALILILIVAFGIYINLKNEQAEQRAQSEKIVEQYQKDIDRIDQLYQQEENTNNGGNISAN